MVGNKTPQPRRVEFPYQSPIIEFPDARHSDGSCGASATFVCPLWIQLVGKRMHDSNFDSRMQLSDIDARLEQFERQDVVARTSLSGLFVMLAVTGYAMVMGTPL